MPPPISALTGSLASGDTHRALDFLLDDDSIFDGSSLDGHHESVSPPVIGA
jgi:hypothetical protein